MDLKQLPKKAFIFKTAPEGGVYYEVHYQIVMTFGSELEFMFLWNGEVIGRIKATYV